jgi:UDP-glucose 4-epimerase
MKILVTGINGNLGSTISKLAKEASFQVFGLDRSNWAQLEKQIQGSEYLIHCAWDLKNSIQNEPTAVVDSNIKSTALILEKIKNSSIKKFIYVSTCAVYGDREDTVENSPCSPKDLNGILKYLNEELIASFCKKHNINYQIFRVFNMYGGNDSFSFLHHIRNALINNSEFTVFNEGQSTRDFIHVEDVAKTILSLLDNNQAPSILNLGSGKATRLIDIINKVKERYPELKTVKSERNEIQKSKANVEKLRTFYNEPNINIFDFIENNFQV